MDKLQERRKEINEIDGKIASLFEERMAAVLKIAEFKKEHGLSIYDESREEEILRAAAKRLEKSEIAEYYVRLVKSVMDISKDYQSRYINGMRVAYSGTEGAFAHIATKKLFKSAVAVPYPGFKEAYDAVVRGECDAAVLPTENSYNGEVGAVTDLMFSGPLYVNAMTELAITQDLLVVPGTKLEDIKKVISHPQALGQCAQFLKENNLKGEEYENTALAAQRVMQMGDKSVAAIASGEAAEIFGLEVLYKNINASRTNTTRFAVFSRAPKMREEKENGVHSIILFTVRNEAGALARAIEIIGKYGFNMRALRSRPMKELLWQYYFYVETEGNAKTKNGEKMMRELKLCCDKLKLLGTYI